MKFGSAKKLLIIHLAIWTLWKLKNQQPTQAARNCRRAARKVRVLFEIGGLIVAISFARTVGGNFGRVPEALSASFVEPYWRLIMACNSKDCLLFSECVDIYGRSNFSRPPCSTVLEESTKPTDNTGSLPCKLHGTGGRCGNGVCGATPCRITRQAGA